MSIQQEIQQAIAAHGMWKRRLQAAIETGKSETPVSVVCQDNQCNFGKWLHSLDQTTKSSVRCLGIKAAHADFHKEAARVLALALSGNKSEAQAGLASGAQFDRLSAKLTLEMMAWLKEVA